MMLVKYYYPTFVIGNYTVLAVQPKLTFCQLTIDGTLLRFEQPAANGHYKQLVLNFKNTTVL